MSTVFLFCREKCVKTETKDEPSAVCFDFLMVVLLSNDEKDYRATVPVFFTSATKSHFDLHVVP